MEPAYFLRLSYSSPTEPSDATGHVIEFNNHGHLFYVRQEEAWFFYGAFALLPLAIVTLILLQWRYGKAALDSPHRSSTFWKYLNGAIFIALTIYMLWPLIGH